MERDHRFDKDEAIVGAQSDDQWALLSNSLSLGMLSEWNLVIDVTQIEAEDVRRFNLYSIVGHRSTARLYSRLLGVKVPTNRQEVEMRPGDRLVVGQIRGRLPEGKVLSEEEMTEYPIVWLLISFARK
jgi:hypothetical protein